MGIRYLDLDPSPGDTDNVLLAKIVQHEGGKLSSGDTKNNLLVKWLRQIVSAPPGPEEVPLADFVSRAGLTDATQIAAVGSLIAAAMAHGWWDKCDLIYPFVGGSAAAHAQNLKSSNFTITWNGTVTHDANGITGNGTTGFGNSIYIPSTSGQATLNSASFSFYRRTLGVAGGHYLNARGSSSGHQLGASVGAGNVTLRANSAGGAATSVFLGFIGASRVVSTQFFHRIAGVTTIVVQNSNTIPPVALYILASNQNGVTISYSTANVSWATVGSGLTEVELSSMSSDVQAFQTDLVRQV